MAVKNPDGPGWFQFALESLEDEKLIGDCGLNIGEMDSRLAEIGFTIARPFWNKGYASESVRALLDYAFDTFGLHRITASADPRNAASCRVMEKAGMVREAHHRQSLWFKGGWADDAGLRRAARRLAEQVTVRPAQMLHRPRPIQPKPSAAPQS